MTQGEASYAYLKGNAGAITCSKQSCALFSRFIAMHVFAGGTVCCALVGCMLVIRFRVQQQLEPSCPSCFLKVHNE